MPGKPVWRSADLNIRHHHPSPSQTEGAPSSDAQVGRGHPRSTCISSGLQSVVTPVLFLFLGAPSALFSPPVPNQLDLLRHTRFKHKHSLIPRRDRSSERAQRLLGSSVRISTSPNSRAVPHDTTSIWCFKSSSRHAICGAAHVARRSRLSRRCGVEG
jgi:hypothetical protein